MNVETKMYLESKILKHVRQNNMVSYDGELSAKGLFLSDLQRKMWYFIRKNSITDQDIYKIARGLEAQGFIEVTAISGRVYLKPQTPKDMPTEQELEVISKDMHTPPKLTPQDIMLGKAVADRYLYQRKREEELAERKQAITPKAEDEDLNTLEDYLKDE